jgi:hypothetical protein
MVVFDKIAIWAPRPRGNFRAGMAYQGLGGMACHGEERAIALLWYICDRKDVVEPYSVSKIISHEILHHLVGDILNDPYASGEGLDAMLQDRTFVDGGRYYFQRDVIDIMCNNKDWFDEKYDFNYQGRRHR